MASRHMGSEIDEALIALLGDAADFLRMGALHQLSESYTDGEQILGKVFSGWDTWGAESAYLEFPMISFLPIAERYVEECCARAKTMAEGRKPVEFPARCAGKLMELMVWLPADYLQPHLPTITATVQSNKIFFRVDLQTLQERMELLECSADQSAAVLDDAIKTLVEDPDSSSGMKRGLIALESIRRNRPEYLDLNAAIRRDANADGFAVASYRIAMRGLAHTPAAGTEESLGRLLLNEDESAVASSVEALVRAGSVEAAEQLLLQIESGQVVHPKWLARGLQRVRIHGLASGIAAVRDHSRDPYQWLMLLVAEIRQLDLESAQRIAFDLQRLQSYSKPLVDALYIYFGIYGPQANQDSLGAVVIDYLERTNSPGRKSLQQLLEREPPLGMQDIDK